MILVSLALAGAQEDLKLFSNAPKRITETIKNNTFESFEFIESGVVLSSDIQCSGYMNANFEMLIPDEEAKENYFRLQFSIRKQ